MSWQEQIKKRYKDKIKENEIMSKHTSMGVGGVAEFFLEAESIEDLIESISFCKSVKVPYKVIGNGTNLIFSDIGYLGVVIHNKTSNITINQSTGEVIVESGVQLAKLITNLAASGLGGIEQLYGIPSTVGGAVVNNAGAHGSSISEYLKSASVMLESEKIASYKADWFAFKYRGSRMKDKRNKAVLLAAKFQFPHKKREVVLKKMQEHYAWRKANQPLGVKTSGSVFKNPDSTDFIGEDIRERSSGYLLEKSGAKKMKYGGAQVSSYHANWIVNTGGATANDVRTLAQKMRELVQDKFSITLEDEIEYLGEWAKNDF